MHHTTTTWQQQPTQVFLIPLLDDMNKYVGDMLMNLKGVSSGASPSNSTTAPTNSTLSLYNELVVGLDAPFIVIFSVLLIASIISYAIQYKTLKRNQHVLFGLVMLIETTAIIQNCTRTSAELVFDYWDLKYDLFTNNVIKAFDRQFISTLLYEQLVVMAFICYVL